MIDLQLYRIRIGGHNCPTGKFKQSGNVFDRQSAFYLSQYPYDVLYESSPLLRPIFIVYYIFMVYFVSLILGMITKLSTSPSIDSQNIYISINLSCSYRLNTHTLHLIKLLQAILTCFVYLKHVRSPPTFFSAIHKIKASLRTYSRFSALLSNSILWLSILNLILVVIVNPSMINPGPTEGLNIAYQNVQGLIPISALSNPNPALHQSKLAELQAFAYLNKPDIIVLNETWLKSSILDNEIFTSASYNIYRLDRTEKTHPPDPNDPKKFRKNGGGILIATRADLEINVKAISSKCSAEILSVQLDFPNGRKIVLCTFYRVGTLGQENFDRVESYLQTVFRRRGIDQVILVGDINLAQTDWTIGESNCNIEQSFVDLFDDLSFTQVIKERTHSKGNMLDILLSTQPETITNLKVHDNMYLCKADHCPITFTVKSNFKYRNATKRTIYNFSKADWASINEGLLRVNWSSKLSKTKGVEQCWKIFKDILFEHANKYIPKIVIKNDFQPPWFDSEVFSLCRKKQRLHAKYKSTDSDEAYVKFSDCRRDLKHMIASKMNANFRNEDDPNYISKKFWSYVKSTNKSHRIPNSVYYGDSHRNTCKEQAALFNKFFSDQFSDKSLYNIDIEKSEDINVLFSVDFNRIEICNLLRSINPNKAQGPDGIHGQILKNCAVSLATPLSILFDISYRTGVLPSDWKIANVVPVHKKGSKNNVENYRPISLTSLIMKQFEKVIRAELMSRCEHRINPSQHGFLPYKSCTTQMVLYTDSIARSLNENLKTDIVYFDFAKAFDSVNHDALLYKLKHHYRIEGLLLQFIKCYLQNRKQQVVIGSSVSAVGDVNSGVPQGSIVGPLLFVLFINDIGDNISQDTNIAMYADDTKIWRNIKSQHDNQTLQNDINLLQDWAEKNLMRFHPSKCHILSASRKRPPKDKFQYMLDGTPLKYSNFEKDLGVIITPKLNFTDHCNKLYSKANSRLALNKRSCHFISNANIKRTLYLTMVRSLFEHCSVIWRPHNTTTMKKLESIQKRGVKWILGENYYSYSNFDYFIRCRRLNFLPLEYKFTYNDLILFHKMVYNLIPTGLPNYMKFYNESSSRRLRSTHFDNLSIVSDIKPTITAKYSKTDVEGTEYKVFENSFFYRTHLQWNKLPFCTREISDSYAFRSKVLEYLWDVALHDQISDIQDQNLSVKFSRPNFTNLNKFLPGP